MKENIRITMKIKQNDERSIWETKGVLFKEEDVYVVSYPDYTGNMLTDNRLELTNDNMRLIRKGAITSDMFFAKDVATTTEYNVIFGKMDIVVNTLEYKFSESENLLNAYVNYELNDNSGTFVKSEIEIVVDKKIEEDN